MEAGGSKKPHALCIPYPSQGHVNPIMQFAKLLHSKGFHITFVNTNYNHRRSILSSGPDSVKGLPDFRFETIPDGLPTSDFDDGPQDTPSLCDSTRKNWLRPFTELLRKLNTSCDVPPVSLIVSDGVMSFGIKAAEELNIAQAQLWTASACSFMGYLHFHELLKRGFMPFKAETLRNGVSDTVIDWIPGMSNIRLRDLPTFIRTTNDELMFEFMGSEARNCLNSSAIIFNTFDELEHEVLQAIIDTKFPNIYTIGPLPLLLKNIPEKDSNSSLGSSLWKEDTDCLRWLDKQKPNSVVYVNFGSVAVMTKTHLKEFAWGLANSKVPFLWIIRPDVVGDQSSILSSDFVAEVKERGLIASWCQQPQVLEHRSVGVFLTHCGWNSMVETICCGVPVICWPFFADQHTNCRYACRVWRFGVELEYDVKRKEAEKLIREMVEGEKGKGMREKALEWRKKAEGACEVGGSSYDDFNRFIREVFN